jgi:hypothetical protein
MTNSPLLTAIKSACLSNENIVNGAKIVESNYSQYTNFEIFFEGNDTDSFDIEYNHSKNVLVLSGNWFNSKPFTICQAAKRLPQLHKHISKTIDALMVHAVENS